MTAIGRRASAALEFAVAAPLMTILIGGVWDLGSAQFYRAGLANGVAAGAEYAYITQLAGTTPTQANITSAVRAASGIPNAATNVTVTYPGSSFGWYCLAGTGTAPTYSASSQGATCADNTAAGYYVTINASFPISGIMSGFLAGATYTMSEQVTVRIK